MPLRLLLIRGYCFGNERFSEMKTLLKQLSVCCLLLVLFHSVSSVKAQSDDDAVKIDTLNEEQLEQSIEQDVEVLEQKELNTFDRQLIAELDAYQQRLILALSEEDAFSLKLSEMYAEYGSLLLKARRYEEAKDVYTEALHIQKINHGIYSAEQLYFIKALFEAAVGIGDSDLVDSYLDKAVAIEQKNEGLVSEHLGEMYLRAGHFYIDQYYQPTRRYKVKLAYLQRARFYFEHILARNSNETLNEVSYPYGELLLVSYLESTLLREMPIIIDGNYERFNVSALSSSPRQAIELERDYAFIKSAYSRSFQTFNGYIRKAREGDDSQEIVNALLSWADTLNLFKRKREATQYYKMAWEESQKILPQDKISLMFEQPQRIPAYNYLLAREDDQHDEEIINVPLVFSIEKDGSVSNIKVIDNSDEQKKYISSARIEAKSLLFRPAIINGDTTAVDEFPYEVKVVVN